MRNIFKAAAIAATVAASGCVHISTYTDQPATPGEPLNLAHPKIGVFIDNGTCGNPDACDSGSVRPKVSGHLGHTGSWFAGAVWKKTF